MKLDFMSRCVFFSTSAYQTISPLIVSLKKKGSSEKPRLYLNMHTGPFISNEYQPHCDCVPAERGEETHTISPFE